MEGENGDPLPARVATLVHAHFDALPTHCKPRTRDDDTREWIPMSGIVAVRAQGTRSETLTCIAVTTGARCLAASQIPRCHGLALHDCHAEILAIRAFNYWVINECLSVIQQEQHSPSQLETTHAFVRRRERNASPSFEICPDISLYMYCTCAPCGDASMELCMAEQDDPTPWSVPSRNNDEESQKTLLDGRAHFSILGVVRRKPARADSEATLSKSCSDKLALRQIKSLLSYPASLLVAPTSSAYITALILPEEEISRAGYDRAFGVGPTGRMKGLVGHSWPTSSEPNDFPKYRFRPFEVLAVPMDIVMPRWPHGKYRSSQVKTSQYSKSMTAKPGNTSAIWIASSSFHKPYCVRGAVFDTDKVPRLNPSSTAVVECIIGGVKQGNKIPLLTSRGASVLSRANMWDLVREVLPQLGEEEAELRDVLESQSYEAFKRKCLSSRSSKFSWLKARFAAMEDAKHTLSPWIPNRGDEDWSRAERERLLRPLCRHSKFSTSSENDPPTSLNTEETRVNTLDNGSKDSHTLKIGHKGDNRKEVGIDVLGKSGEIIVLPQKKRRKPRVLDGKKIGKEKLGGNGLFNLSAKPGTNAGGQNVKLIDDDYNTFLDELRDLQSPGDELSREEWINLQAKLEVSFTMNQLLAYLEDFERPPSKDTTTQPKDSETTWLAEDNSVPTSETLDDTQKDAYKIKGININHRKEHVAERILRECWQLTVQDEAGGLDISLPSHIISLLVESDQYSLEELAHSHNAKIELFSSANMIRVFGSKRACESVREIVNTYTSNIRTEPIGVPLLNNLRISVGESSNEDLFRWIAKKYGVSIEHQSRKSTALASYFAGNEGALKSVIRDLDLASHSKASLSVPFCSYVPSSTTGYLNPIRQMQAKRMSLDNRTKPWARWQILTKLSQMSDVTLLPLFKEHHATCSTEILQVLRGTNGQPVGPDIQEKLTATIGQCLFHNEQERYGMTTSTTASRLGELSIPRLWHAWASGAQPFVSDLPELRGEKLYRFRLTPCSPNADNAPILEVELGVPLIYSSKPLPSAPDVTIKKIEAIVKQDRIDYLFPEARFDIRFTRTLTRDVFGLLKKESNESMRDAIVSALEPITSKLDDPLPPSCQLPLPASLLQNLNSNGGQKGSSSANDGGGVKLFDYWLPSMNKLSGSLIRSYDFMGEKLTLNNTWFGQLGSKRVRDLNLEMHVAQSPLHSLGGRIRQGNNVNAESTINQEFTSFYRTACNLAFSLSTYEKKDEIRDNA
ncbi:hypothetical protein BGW36DRAFT_325271 [Talaromyces proteolyticus]|uniref:A to I editase domain-containing protein n=1 Tax=Talaromyces proteolyticus TaxID=1131652 RepID=A0AAD4KJ41_9EURO|nr:uncharacterized protein BGW36DRAFT_325271 [Talaromyces proteolyticus]KAH8692839.1 hypothetical protein BGW36DRAFT_325271 [Talaromyces proteolyticus]